MGPLATELQSRMCIFAAETLVMFGLCPQVLTSGCPDKSHPDPETVMEGGCLTCLHLGSEPSDPSRGSHPCHMVIKIFSKNRKE